MKLRMRFIMTSAVLLGIVACSSSHDDIKTVRGSWEVAEKKVAVGDVNQVALYTPGDLNIEIGQKPELRIEADDNILPYLTTQEANGKLEIFSEAGIRIGNQSLYLPPTSDDELFHFSGRVRVHLIPRRRIKYYLTVSGLESIRAWNIGKINIPDLEENKISIISGSFGFTTGKLTAKKVELNPGGDGNWHDTQMQDMNIESLYAEELKVQINSNQNVNIAGGTVQRQEIVINNEGDYNSLKVNCAEADVWVNSSGSATLRVSERLNVKLTGSGGNVYYSGNPEITVTGPVEDSGKLIKIGE